MKHNYNLDDLDEFLSDSADQHRMYPSDKVWRNINNELHGHKRWPALSFAAILTGAIITAGLILIHPDKSLFTVNLPEQKTNNSQYAFAESKTQVQPGINFFDGNNTRKHSSITVKRNAPSEDVMSAPNSSNEFVTIKEEDREIAGSPILSASKVSAAPGEFAGIQPVVNTIATQVAPEEKGGIIGEQVEHLYSRNFAEKATYYSKLTLAPKSFEKDLTTTSVNSFAMPSGSKNRWSSFIYVTPSISYRYLSEAPVVDMHMRNNGSVAPNALHDVNKYVKQRPIAGFEFGGGMMYQLSPSVQLRMGLQVNSRGYSIDAFANRTELSTLVLNRGFYTDSIVAVSTINNFGGYRAITVYNRYFELSAPVTLDLKLAGKNKLEFYVGAGLQPTYQFNKSMYVVSSDYKNYVQQPNLARQFNLNTSIEAFLSYRVGKLTWQAGPQLRYQMLSGTSNIYPVREHLFDYGLKIGVVKSLK